VAGNTLIGLIKAVSENAVLVDPDPASVRLPDPKDQIIWIQPSPQALRC
jgi:hypothetical protein